MNLAFFGDGPAAAFIRPIAIVLAVLCLFAGAHAWARSPDQNYHPICVSGSEQGASAPCIAFKDFVRANKKFGVRKDGWITDLRDSSACKNECEPAPFEIGTLEYKSDHDGAATRWQNEQLQAILRSVKSTQTTNKLYVIVFIHGWHHDAHDNGEDYSDSAPREDQETFDNLVDRNLRYFKHILAKARHELNVRGDVERKVLGVYVGWNGGPPDAVLNIGRRARAADRIGNSDDFATDLKKLSDAVHAADSSNRMLVVGHSLGGRLISRYMLRHFARTMEPLGRHTLVATINAAVGADAFDDLMQTPTRGGPPSWINITSEDDWATGTLYPIATSLFGRVAQFGRGIADKPGRDSASQTIGHYNRYLTHRLWTCIDDAGEKDGCDSSSWWRSTCPTPIERNGRNTRWYALRRDSHVACVALKYMDNNGRATTMNQRYRVALVDQDGELVFHAPAGSMWNITTDTTFIGADPDHEHISAPTHNAFVQTNFYRMLLELAFAR